MRAASAVLALCSLVWAHGSTEPTPPPGDSGGGWSGTPTAAGGGTPTGPGTGTGGGAGGPATAGRRAGPSEWRMWWERNREQAVDMRSRLRRPTALTRSDRPEAPRDPVGGRRNGILETLRRLAVRARDRSLRAAAVMALGRMGEDCDARLFLDLARDGDAPTPVREASLVALGILPPISDDVVRGEVRERLELYVNRPELLPTRARGLALCAAGLRAREDRRLVGPLLARARGHKLKTDEAANLLYALGLTGHAIVIPELVRAVVKGRFGGERIGDLARAHAVQALGLVGGTDAVRPLCLVLRARSVRWETRRSAAMALARVLHETPLSLEAVEPARAALLKTMARGPDYVLKGYAALALGDARPPLCVDELLAAAESGTQVDIRPFLNLALGMAARSLGGDAQARRIRAFLLDQLDATREPERASSLSFALGLAGAREASDLLIKRLRRSSSPDPVRGAAAYALGLMGERSAEVHALLEELALAGKKPVLVEDVVLALGLSGRRDIAPKLVELLQETDSSLLQGRIILALGHLDHPGTVEPLHAILRDERERGLVREFAATALALLSDRREKDILFSLDAYHNLHATTLATHELLRLY